MSSRRYLEAAAAIREMIRRNGWGSGTRLPPERALAGQFSLPRATVREALVALEAAGLVEVRAASGVYILEPSVAVSCTLLKESGPFEMLRARQVLESTIAAEAARSWTGALGPAMEQALDQEEQEIAQGRQSYGGDAAFHRMVAEASGNPVLVAASMQLWSDRGNSVLWARLQARAADDSYRAAWCAHHREILSALKRQCPDAARSAMWHHLGSVAEILLQKTDIDQPR